MKLFSLALLAAVASAAAVPGDDWKEWKCPAPVTTTVVKEIKYPPVTVTVTNTATTTARVTVTVTTTATVTNTATITSKVTSTVTSTYTVPYPQKTNWKDW